MGRYAKHWGLSGAQDTSVPPHGALGLMEGTDKYTGCQNRWKSAVTREVVAVLWALRFPQGITGQLNE